MSACILFLILVQYLPGKKTRKIHLLEWQKNIKRRPEQRGHRSMIRDSKNEKKQVE